MSLVGDVVIALIMLCAAIGAVAAIFNDREGLGKEFLEGLHAIGHIFIPVAGIMASIPYLSAFVKTVFGPVFSAVGADPAIAATSFIAVDMGGYQLAHSLQESPESWIMAMTVGYMAGATMWPTEKSRTLPILGRTGSRHLCSLGCPRQAGTLSPSYRSS